MTTQKSELSGVIQQEIDINASPEVVFQSVLDEMAGIIGMDGGSLKLKLEAWPGGRWFRDMGNNTGHLWGHVQVIKPPTLIEICGPLMMSFPTVNHVSYRITAQDRGSHLSFKHRMFGEIDDQFRDGMVEGWQGVLDKIKSRAGGR